MRKHAYIENESDAHCSECEFRCEPICDSGIFGHDGVPGGLHSYGEEWTSQCCSAKIVEEDGSEWTADVVEGCPEP
jgi:hypothetical protein